jgi:hypothetical protein
MARRLLYPCTVIFFLLFTPLGDFTALPASAVMSLERDAANLESQDPFAPKTLRKIRDRRHASPLIVSVCSGIVERLSAERFTKSQFFGFSSPARNQPRTVIFRI